MTLSPAADPVRVYSLAGHGGVDMAVRGFGSLAACSDRPLHFVVHDDGTLEDHDRGRLASAIGNISFVGRAVADEAVEPLLQPYPYARALRQRNPLALKLLDIPLLAAGSGFAYTDTDILAFQPFTGLFEWPDAETTGVFMPDSQNAYSLRPWHLLGSDAIAVPMGVNTGLMMFRKASYDLEFIEWFVSRELSVYRRIPGWIEQTCWAALAQRGRCRLYDAAQVRVIEDRRCLVDPALVLGHFTSSIRSLWADAHPASPAGRPAVALRTCPPAPLSAARLAREQLARAARRSRLWVRRTAGL